MQGEGDKISARHYNRDLQEFVAEGKAAKGSKTRVSVDDLIAKGRTVVDRVRPYFAKLRSKLGHK